MSESETGYSSRNPNELDHLDVDTMRSLYTLELSGEDFYHALADRVSDHEAARLLRNNGREEGGHAQRLLRALSLKEGADVTPSAAMLERRPVRLPDAIDVRLLTNLVRGELDGDVGYQRWRTMNPTPRSPACSV